MHVHQKLDQIFTKGHLWKHRTMRTFFDMNSSEWKHTTLDEKLDYIYTAIDSGSLSLEEMIDAYTDFYLYSLANKEHVLLSLDESLAFLKEKSKERGREL